MKINYDKLDLIVEISFIILILIIMIVGIINNDSNAILYGWVGLLILGQIQIQNNIRKLITTQNKIRNDIQKIITQNKIRNDIENLWRIENVDKKND